MFLYYVMTNDTSTPELVKKVSYYNEKLNDAIPDWADMSLKKESRLRLSFFTFYNNYIFIISSKM